MNNSANPASASIRISILNAGQENDYLYGLVSGLSHIAALEIEVVDSDNSEHLFDHFPAVAFFNLRGDNLSPQSFFIKAWRIARYYLLLLRYALTTRARLFHIEWENSLRLFDRTLLILYYKLLEKKIVFTAHNVYKEARDERAGIVHRLSLKCLYRLVDRIVVHTSKMKEELCSLFSVPPGKVVVIPHGVNIRIPRTGVDAGEARAKLGIPAGAKVALFFGLIDRYKGLEPFIDAMAGLIRNDPSFFLLLAGKPKRKSDYVPALLDRISQKLPPQNVRHDVKFIPVPDVETYFAAADCLVLPYRRIYQSGILFLAYRFGIPVVATDVGNFREDVREGVTGFISKSDNAGDLADTLAGFFSSDLFRQRERTRKRIVEEAERDYSWVDIGKRTYEMYLSLLGTP
jgi:D-inositol-3-phosphate glycosyltransferase